MARAWLERMYFMTFVGKSSWQKYTLLIASVNHLMGSCAISSVTIRASVVFAFPISKSKGFVNLGDIWRRCLYYPHMCSCISGLICFFQNVFLPRPSWCCMQRDIIFMKEPEYIVKQSLLESSNYRTYFLYCRANFIVFRSNIVSILQSCTSSVVTAPPHRILFFLISTATCIFRYPLLTCHLWRIHSPPLATIKIAEL